MSVTPPNRCAAPFAHSADGDADWEPLFSSDCPTVSGHDDCLDCEGLKPSHGHLNKVAQLAAKFAGEMFAEGSPERAAAREWGRLAGLWHDLGKFTDTFQSKLRGEQVAVEHAGAGAVFAKCCFQQHLQPGTHHYPLAAVIAGHHAGLSNFRDQGGGRLTPLLQRIRNNEPLRLDWDAKTERILTDQKIPALPSWCDLESTTKSIEFGLPFFSRMLFSCLIDADSLVTEALETNQRIFDYSSISELSKQLDQQLADFSKKPDEPGKERINKERRRILSACQDSANQGHGVFTLNVPTGGGKTLSGMSFALRHAAHCSQHRVIVVAPYTTIIEQTAAEYRLYLGSENVIEHHSNLDDFNTSETQSESERKKQLAAENWDAPVIVTTTVQFFESLFANKRGRCRKLHNIANSIIVIDEAQCLPTSHLDPTLAAINQLVDHYHCSVVLSTATQPALHQRKKFPHGFPKTTAIIPVALTEELHQSLTQQRVRVEWDLEPPKNISDASRLLGKGDDTRKLIVVNTRREASEIFERLKESYPSEQLFHLSTNLCAAHRQHKLARIKERLDTRLPCTVVSTQLIECGVDHSYQWVIRALAGLDSLAQSAGRCNRHGEIDEGGRFIVYRSDIELRGFLANCASITRSVIGDDPPPHLADLSLYDDYFRRLYQAGASRDTSSVLAAYEERNLEDVADRYKLIEDHKPYTAVVAWGDEGSTRLKKVRAILQTGQLLSRGHLRSLQPFTVSLSVRDFEIVRPYAEPMLDGGYSHFIHPESLAQIYCDDLGLKLHTQKDTYLGCHE